MTPPQDVLTVSGLTRLIRYALEDRFSAVTVEGEISNYYASSAGHIYFTLKDAGSQIKTVFFRGNQRGHTALLDDGLKVRVQGEISVYEKGGNYQIIARRIQAAGKGDLHAQFEELKRKLNEEGLFSEERKQPLPRLPQRIAVITSPKGAAIRDFLNVISRRYPNMHILIIPVRVQGEGAAREISAAIETANAREGLDVIVLTRGGGSLEDLWSFNEEIVARAIAASALPVLSAVGHEVDFTISDFVADFRAPTPSAAAELLVGRKDAFEDQLQGMQRRMAGALRQEVLQFRNRLLRAAHHPAMREPAMLVRQHQQRLDGFRQRMDASLMRQVVDARHGLSDNASRLQSGLTLHLQTSRSRLDRLDTVLHALSPERVLERGYSITYAPDGAVLRSADAVRAGDRLTTRLKDGQAISIVEEKK